MNIGSHITKTYAKKTDRIERHIEEFIRKYDIPDARTFQIFVASPQSFNLSIKTESEMESLKKFVEIRGINLYTHSRYIDNIFSQSVKPQTIGFVKKELDICDKIGATFVVHLYKYPHSVFWNHYRNWETFLKMSRFH